MRNGGGARPDRIGSAGADVLGIRETSVWVVSDEPAGVEPWCHPVWPLCRGLAALGFGSVELRGAESCRDALALWMAGLRFEHGPAPGRSERFEGAARCDVLLHLGNDPAVREACARFARARSAHFVSLRWGTTHVEMQSLAGLGAEGPARHEAEVASEPLAPLARIAAGLALQETLIVAGRLAAAAPAEARVCFDAAAETRTRRAEHSAWPPVRVESVIVEVIGAGGVGIHLLEALAPLLGAGCQLRIFDFDRVGPENLALQASFSPADVGRPKATVLAEKLAPVCDPALDLRPLVVRYQERPALPRPSLRVACPDNFAARAHANDCSLADGVPLVEAGSSPLAAQQRSYLPGRTACLAHRIPHLSARAVAERGRASCAEQQAFTLPGTNMVCGGILAAEALRALDPRRFGWPSRGTIVYDARFPARFGVVDALAACAHSRGQG